MNLDSEEEGEDGLGASSSNIFSLSHLACALLSISLRNSTLKVPFRSAVDILDDDHDHDHDDDDDFALERNKQAVGCNVVFCVVA